MIIAKDPAAGSSEGTAAQDAQNPATGPLDGEALRQAVEALLFASGEPLSVETMAAVLGLHDRDGHRRIEQALADVGREFGPGGRHGFELVPLAGGWALRSSARWRDVVGKLFDLAEENTRLSPAALECLAIIAYLQPVSRPQIAEIRGVNSDSAVRTLLERELITEVGRAGGASGAVLYGTTQRFEVMFGLAGPEDLPPLQALALSEEEKEELRRRLGMLSLPE